MNLNDAYKLISDKLTTWLHELIKMLPNILTAVIVLVIGLFLAKQIKKLAAKFINKISAHKVLNGLLVAIIHLFFIGIVIFIVLSILQLDKAVTSLLAGVGITGLAIAFAFQDIAANFISGVFILLRKPIHVGDIVKLKTYMGKIDSINLRDTVVRTFQGQLVIIPNKEVYQNPIENFTQLGKRRLDISVGVSYGDDLEKVQRVTMEAVKNIEGLSKDDDTTFFYQEFGDSSINFLVRLWLNSPEQNVYWTACHQAIMRIKKAFDENDIMIPFPISTLDFGIKGGVSLSETPIQSGK
ncbi:MAG: mechanosensitive ion channel [Chitinophagaceae bacterium]